jgi:N-acetylglucosaminyl-diphospho-decaprenol L-rhamnosyltransferase
LDSNSNFNKSNDKFDVTVIVVNYNTGYLLDRMFSSLRAAQGELRVQTILVDNASADDSIDIVRDRYPDVELILNTTNVGFGRANNQALPLVRGRYVLLLNTDAFVASNTLVRTINFMENNPRCGILGVKLVDEAGRLQPSCRYFPTPWNVFLAKTGLNRIFSGTRLVDDLEWDHGSIRECDWVPGCYYLVRKLVIDRVGLFDPRFFLYSEEVDHCKAARTDGWTVTFYPFTSVIHVGGESAKFQGPLTAVGHQIFALQVESELLYFRKQFGLSGLLSAVFLAICGDIYLASKQAVMRTNKKPFSEAFRHLKVVFRILTKTKLATQATR